MKLSTTIAIIAILISSASVSANVFDNDYYENNLRPFEINTNVDAKAHDDHFEGVTTQTEMDTNVPIVSEDAHDYDINENGV